MRGLNHSYITALLISFVQVDHLIWYKEVHPKCNYFISDNMPLLDCSSEAYRANFPPTEGGVNGDPSQCNHKTMRHTVAEH